MPRATNNVASRRRRKKILKLAKGFSGRRKSLIRTASDVVDKAGKYAYRDRRVKKRNFRSLWIVRISAASRMHGLNYGSLMHGLKLANVDLDRKVLADLAVSDEAGFGKLAEVAKQALPQ